ncbi:MAG: HAD family hydrolase [Clostridia bacterium]|nr:HAD family hydrolase [Clostridia bacterium]
MKTKAKKIALIYDFDKTLVKKDVPEFNLFPDVMQTSWKNFMIGMKNLKKTGFNAGLGYLYYFFKTAKENGVKLTKGFFNNAGRNIEYFSGVESWFNRINQYAIEKGIIVEHYIISSGIKEIIDGTDIAKNFKKIYASIFHYNSEGEVDWPSCVVDYGNKSQYIFRINRGILDFYNDKGMNEFMAKENRKIPFENIVYIGDGLTDVPCMKVVKEKGGKSIAVYSDERSLKSVKDMFFAGWVNKFVKADYTEGTELDIEIKNFINNVKVTEIINSTTKNSNGVEKENTL